MASAHPLCSRKVVSRRKVARVRSQSSAQLSTHSSRSFSISATQKTRMGEATRLLVKHNSMMPSVRNRGTQSRTTVHHPRRSRCHPRHRPTEVTTSALLCVTLRVACATQAMKKMNIHQANNLTNRRRLGRSICSKSMSRASSS